MQGKPGLLLPLKQLPVLHTDCGDVVSTLEGTETPEAEVRELFHMEIQRRNAVGLANWKGKLGNIPGKKNKD